ncbi:VOC family protein [Pelagibacteraceae bacterium]|nr:VOC family protein [Pelagibacteraceae bacterium]
MFAFITIGTNNLKKSSVFYNKILKPLKIKKVLSHTRYFGYAKKETPEKIELYLIRPHNKKKATIGNGTMITFKANSKKNVNEFYKIGISLGAKDEGKPGPRHGKDYYAYLRDLDGNKICIFKKI